MNKRTKLLDGLLLVAATFGLGASVSRGGFGPAQGGSGGGGGGSGPTTSTWSTVLGNGASTSGQKPDVSPADYVIFENSSGAAVSAANTGRLIYNSSTQTFQVSVNGGAYTTLSTSGTPTWSSVLATGNTSGAHNAVISAGQGLGMIGASPGVNQITFGTGGGGIIHVSGPNDQTFAIHSGSGRTLELVAEGSAAVAFGNNGQYRWQVVSSGALATQTGLGAISQVIGPGDQPFAVTSGAAQNLNLQTNNGTTVLSLASGGGATITPAANTTALTLTGGTQTVNSPLISGSATWNNAAVTFQGIYTNTINTASVGGAVGSMLMQLQVSSADIFTVDPLSRTRSRRDSTVADGRPIFQFVRYRSGGALNSGDIIGSWLFTGGFTAGNDSYGASIDVFADAAPSNSVVPGRIAFAAAEPGGTVPDVCSFRYKQLNGTSNLGLGWTASTTDSSGAFVTAITQPSTGLVSFDTSTPGNAAANLQLNTVTKYGGFTTAALGLSPTIQTGTLSAQSGTSATLIASFTVDASNDRSLEISPEITVTATAVGLQMTITYTDDNSQTHTAEALQFIQNGGTTVLTTATTQAAYAGLVKRIQVKANTTVSVQMAQTSGTYNSKCDLRVCK